MVNQGFRRSYKAPPGYTHLTENYVPLLNQVYIGYVKKNSDSFKMGRLEVWIPEFASDPNDEDSWFRVQYCSPMAGATPAQNNKKEGRELDDTQQSYGWWSVPPDIDNQVVVMFINGDPNRGIYIGGLYQQFMNHMVPGIPTGTSFQEGEEGSDPPVAEYNKWDPSITNSDNQTRARFEPLHEGLKNQGLYTDSQRGPSNSGARRDEIPVVHGFKSPGGTQFVIDDDEENPHVRIRTANGTQLLINDAAGYVYMISGNGNSWFQISDEGIDAYTSNSISMRSQQDINFHADGNMNLYARRGMNIFGGGGGSMQFGKGLDLLVGSDCNISSAGGMNLMTKGAANISGDGNVSLSSGGTAAIAASGGLGVSAGGNLFLQGSQIRQNSGSGPRAQKATEARGPAPEFLEDRELNPGAGYPEIETSSIVSRLPTHEPWNGHPRTSSGPVRSRVDLNFSNRIQVDGDGNPISNSDDIQPGSEETVPTDNTEFVAPTTGIAGSQFGPRKPPKSGASSIHQGLDVRCPVGTPLVAMRDGVISFAGRRGGYGLFIEVKHDNGYTTRFGHLSVISARVGQKVKVGQVIGKTGNTGVSTGPHLHFEIRKNGVAINPSRKLRNTQRGARMTAGRN